MCRKADNKLCLTFECIQNLVGGTGFAEKVTEWQQNREEEKAVKTQNCIGHIYTYMLHGVHFIVL